MLAKFFRGRFRGRQAFQKAAGLSWGPPATLQSTNRLCRPIVYIESPHEIRQADEVVRSVPVAHACYSARWQMFEAFQWIIDSWRIPLVAFSSIKGQAPVRCGPGNAVTNRGGANETALLTGGNRMRLNKRITTAPEPGAAVFIGLEISARIFRNVRNHSRNAPIT